MTTLIIEKNGDISEKKLTNLNLEKLYLICSYRSNKNFVLLHDWIIGENIYELYGKKIGTNININKYRLPSPIDNEIYYGKLCIIKKNGNINLEEWIVFYNTLYKSDTSTNTNTNTSIEKHIYMADNTNTEYSADIELTYEIYEDEK